MIYENQNPCIVKQNYGSYKSCCFTQEICHYIILYTIYLAVRIHCHTELTFRLHFQGNVTSDRLSVGPIQFRPSPFSISTSVPIWSDFFSRRQMGPALHSELKNSAWVKQLLILGIFKRVSQLLVQGAVNSNYLLVALGKFKGIVLRVWEQSMKSKGYRYEEFSIAGA